MDKLKMHSIDRVKKNIERVGMLFPNALTETINEEGNLVKAIDFDILKQELSDFAVEGREERFQFTWPDKKNSILLANVPISKTLRPCRKESNNFDNTENLYIEGDNLDVLKLLQETYLGKIKMIYIDPPYNTGNDFIYNDAFVENAHEYVLNSGQFDEEGNRLVQNTESNGRYHSDWLNMIYPRLKLAKDLLSNEGIIFISIDSNEYENLKKVCNEIFGDANLVSDFIWINNERGRSIDKYISNTNEFILVYAKDINLLKINLKKETGESILAQYPEKDEISYYKKGDPLFNNNSKFNIDTRPNLVYSIYVNSETGEKRCIDEKIKNDDGSWTLPEENFLGDDWIKIIPPLRNTNKKIGCWRWGIPKFMAENEQELILVQERSGKYMFYSKNRLDADGAKLSKYKNIISSITSSSGTTECVNLLEGKFFDHPKPSKLIKLLCEIGSSEEDIVLDFFSGSGTTAHAVMQLNAEDGGKRKFIMVQLPETIDEKSEAFKAGYKNICEIGKERIRRAGKKIKADNSLESSHLDIGFKVLKLDSSNMKDVYYRPSEITQNLFDDITDNIKEDRTPEDLLFQVMLDLGVLLSSKIEETTIGEKRVFNVADNFLIACFDNNITDDVVKVIAQQQPYYAVFRDSSIDNDSVATNFEQIFATYSPTTVRKVL